MTLVDFDDSRALLRFKGVRFDDVFRSVTAKFDHDLRPRLPTPDFEGGADEAAAAQYLELARRTIEDELIAQALHYTSLQWLFYLRCVPGNWWTGQLKTTAVYDAALAEIISGKSTKSSSGNIPDFSVNAEIANAVATFCAGTICLSHIHTNLRWFAKGASINFAGKALGSAEPTPELRNAVTLYDSRVEVDQGLVFSRTGLGSAENVKGDCISWIPVVPKMSPEMPSKYGYPVRFALDYRCLDELAKFNRAMDDAGCPWWENESGLLIAFLNQTIELIRKRRVEVLRCGCLFPTREFVRSASAENVAAARKIANAVFPGTRTPNTIEKIIRAVGNLEGNTWPMVQGPPVRTDGDVVCLDLYSASMRLNQTASLKAAGGKLGGLKGPELERSVQSLIDDSPWALSPAMREILVGKKPRRGGQDLTDLDAVGSKDGVLLLVSCKSRPYSAAYDMGERNLVKQVEQDVLAALKQWTEKTDYMRDNPLCLSKFDFSQYKILPVVCFPFAPYVTIGPATAEVASGLRAVASLAELRAWLFR
jgi:hypothetical protein